MEKILLDVASTSAGPLLVVGMGLFMLKGIVKNAESRIDGLRDSVKENTGETKNLTIQMARTETGVVHLSKRIDRIENKLEVSADLFCHNKACDKREANP